MGIRERAKDIAGMLVTFAACVFLAQTARAMIASPRYGMEALSVQSMTLEGAAHVTATNVNAWPVRFCYSGVVSAKRAGGGTADGHPVCGEVPARGTLALDSPYRAGAVLDLCNRATQYDPKVLDWNACTFEVLDRTPLLAR